jgi:UDP-3-O-[3-hydroxymyristoyl] glucosamine N-acyltransferase
MSDRTSSAIWTLRQLADELGAEIVGDPERQVTAVRPLESAGVGDASFVVGGRYLATAAASSAGVLLVAPGMAEDPRLAGRDLLVADPVSVTMTRLVGLLHPRPAVAAGVHPTAVVADGAAVDPTAHLGPFVVVGEGSRIGPGCVLHAHAVVGRDCVLACGAEVHPHVVLYDGVELGEAVTVHAGTVLGADGFGYATHGGVHHKVPQVGRVVIERDVEIGANAAIDRATLGETRIGAGSKVDNLVQVGHNVRTGEACLLCGQSGIAGSSTLGAGVVLGGQSGIADHLTLGDGVQVAAKSAVLESVAGGQLGGTPAIQLPGWRRQVVLLQRLGEMLRRLRTVEKALEARGATGKGATGNGATGNGERAAGRSEEDLT